MYCVEIESSRDDKMKPSSSCKLENLVINIYKPLFFSFYVKIEWLREGVGVGGVRYKKFTRLFYKG